MKAPAEGSRPTSALRDAKPAWRDCALVLIIAALPGLLAWSVFGTIETSDSSGYLEYAAQIRSGHVPAGSDLLHSGPIPISLFRAPGYPALLAALQTLFPLHWNAALVLLQIVASALVAAATYSVARRLCVPRGFASAAALAPAVSLGLLLQIAVLTDALNAALFTGAAVALLGPGLAEAAAAGVLLAIATTLREATPFLALAFLPLAWCGGERRWARVLALLLPTGCVVALMMGWNQIRIGYPLMTTTAEINMVQPLQPLIQQGLPVYAGDAPFDRVARETLTRPDYQSMLNMLQRLFEQQHMTAPELASAATARYVRAWLHFPMHMFVATARNFRTTYLQMPFAPVDTLADLVTFSGRQSSPDFVKLNVLWHRMASGDLAALGWLVSLIVTRTIAIAVALTAAIGPWLPGRNWQMRGLWCICAGVPLIYMPVHLDARFLVPILPLTWIIAAGSLPLRRPSPAKT